MCLGNVQALAYPLADLSPTAAAPFYIVLTINKNMLTLPASKTVSLPFLLAISARRSTEIPKCSAAS